MHACVLFICERTLWKTFKVEKHFPPVRGAEYRLMSLLNAR